MVGEGRVARVEVIEVRVEGEGVRRKVRVAVERAVVLFSEPKDEEEAFSSESFSRRIDVSLMGGVALLVIHQAVSIARDCRIQA